ncbi:MAG: hypothetical protein AMJ93_08445 [Anaerolineae bacterium SM23_84]|nr:MAG: hypothetical protein AMJ93_08445 [Anaerolineae bacterium SM23_84]
MSEYINNREHRQKVLKRLIRNLHEGRDLGEVKEEFRKLLRDVSPTEISQMEQALIAEGLPPEQIQELCDVHVQIFRESLDKQAPPGMTPGHPVHTFRAENEAVAKAVEELKQNIAQIGAAGNTDAAAEPVQQAQETLNKLMQLDTHYLRKENLLFPFLEKHGVTGPSSVMWGIHNDIRDGLKELRRVLQTYTDYDFPALVAAIEQVANPLTTAITEMIYKEDNILYPMALEKLSDAEWLAIKEQTPEMGYCLIEPPDARPPVAEKERPAVMEEKPAQMKGYPSALPLDTGSMTPKEINLLLKNLPVDITFVDKDDTVRYFSQTEERIFVRTPAVIGREVQNCHPPASVHVVNRILDDFRQGHRDVAEFWIQMQGKFVHIRYFPLRDENGEYVGTIEVTQDVTSIRELTGQRRLLEEK